MIFRAGRDTPEAFNFALSKSSQIQSNTFDKSVKRTLNTLLLSTMFFNLSIIKKKNTVGYSLI